MDLSFTAEQQAFRQEVREWIESAMPPHIREKAQNWGHFEHEEVMEWHRILYQKGWAAPAWPKKYGGPGWDVARQFIFNEESIRANAPQLPPFAISMVGPLLMQFGSEEQKERYLPKMLSGEEYWCQGYSEPNAGSDLAAVQSPAVLQDDHFLVNGHKTWTSHAQYADWIFCLLRTDSSGKKQEGISFILIDMKTPGVKVSPYLTTGGLPSFCDTYFEDVKVPRENLVGQLHGGWTVAKALLGHERIAISGITEAESMVPYLKWQASQTRVGDHRLIDEPGIRHKIARLEMRIKPLRIALLRTLSSLQEGKAPGPESSILKLRGTDLLQLSHELAMEIMGHNSIAWFNEGVIPESQKMIPSMYNYLRAATIYGGSNEIQKNVIAKHILGLPS